MRRFEISKETLIREYCDNGLKLSEIGRKLGCSGKSVMNCLADHGIPRRNSGPIVGKEKAKRLIISKKDLEHYYLIERLTFEQIGDILGCSGRAVGIHAKALGIPARSCWKGYGEIGGWYWGQLIENARRRDIDVGMTIKEGWELFLQQKRQCALSGVELAFSHWDQRKETTASLDRINSSIRTYQRNSQWIHKTIQPMKMNLVKLNFCSFAGK